MGTNAVYLAIDDSDLDALWKLEGRPFRDRFMEIEEEGCLETLNIGKIWDALHCTLTGVSARTPIDGNKLSEAIVGVYPKVFDDEDYSIYVSAIDNGELEDIVIALKTFDSPKLALALDLTNLKKQKVYPYGIWLDEVEGYVHEMHIALQSICDFFLTAKKSGKHILATVL
ncbi:YfbM family protein [Acaryochloris marina]|uniref:DUF1877 domain-containing protein n=1 Tax=Acaryochloris marina (strain MBIC 11017) TaxID=329726 RepID=B0CBM5_ACAM1|nr:YfbM family protein [Acaryochloris marina]ABW29143.1 hypothetical protein AM1_4162 [Acaryochloris marina MBIC11017]BDM78090.1 hypothetical protein AM10699_09600 [Acaryochloris marina MBIC10699]